MIGYNLDLSISASEAIVRDLRNEDRWTAMVRLIEASEQADLPMARACELALVALAEPSC
jgi:hypothetical protein